MTEKVAEQSWMRFEFEQALAEHKKLETYLVSAIFIDGKYGNLLLESSWLMWKASRKSTAGEIAKKMRDRVTNCHLEVMEIAAEIEKEYEVQP